jgi:hypothetical protein
MIAFITCLWYIFLCFLGIICYDLLFQGSPVCLIEYLFRVTLIPVLWMFLIGMTPHLIHDIGIVFSRQKTMEIERDKIIYNKGNNSNSSIHVIYRKMDDEGRAYLSEAKLEWKKSGLTQSQIDRKGLRFAMSHYTGRFVTWLQLPKLPRLLPSIKIKY